MVGIKPGFDLKAYRTIAVTRFAVTGALNDDEDRKLADATSTFLQSELVRRLRASGLFDRVINLPETAWEAGPGQQALRVDGAIKQLSGGSRALRFWVGFGAGRSKVQAETRFIDVGSRQPVIVTADRRVAAISEALSIDYGGDSEGLLKQSFDNLARDVAKFLVRFSRGEAPSP